MCGLFGHVSSKDNCQFNWDKFNLLGVDNDERGGDSVGRLVGDQYSTFVSTKVKTSYFDYVVNHRNDEPSHIAIGHTRKASVGAINTDNAQPIRLELEDGFFNMVHNGTIHNYTDLAEKYGIEHVGKTDSQVLASIIKDHGFEVLKEYNGTAALIIKDDRVPDTLFVFKGESLGFTDKLSEERPLYYYQESENSMYISSKEEGLYFIGGDADTVNSFVSNTLYEIKEGAVVNTTFYDRTKCNQNKVFTPVVITNNNRAIGFNTRRTYEGYENWNENYSLPFNSGQYGTQQPVKTKYQLLWESDKWIEEDFVNIVSVYKLRYYSKNKLVSGQLNINKYGMINYHKKDEGDFTFYFYAGILLKNKQSYSAVRSLFGKSKFFKDTIENLKKIVPHSVYPIGTLGKSYGDILKVKDTPFNYSQYFTGEVLPLFSPKKYVISTGSCTDIIDTTVFNHNIEKEFPELFESVKEEERETFDTWENEDEDNTEDTLDDAVLKEIKDIHESLLLAFDASRNTLNIIGDSSKQITILENNLSIMEDILYDDNKFRTKKLKLVYE